MEKRQQSQQKSRLGILLTQRGLISRQQLDEALELQAKTGMRLGELLVSNGWLTEKQLNKALRSQSRVRLIAAVGALLIGPMQPFMANAHSVDEGITADQFIERTGIQELSELEMSGVSGRGMTEHQATTNYERLLDIVNNNLTADEDAQAITTLETLLGSLIPVTNLLDADIEISGTEFDPGPRTTINTDGSLDVQLPSKIRQISLRNVRVSGSEGAHMGDVVINNLQFGAGTSVKIRLH